MAELTPDQYEEDFEARLKKNEALEKRIKGDKVYRIGGGVLLLAISKVMDHIDSDMAQQALQAGIEQSVWVFGAGGTITRAFGACMVGYGLYEVGFAQGQQEEIMSAGLQHLDVVTPPE